jgi:hypothetical protein
MIRVNSRLVIGQNPFVESAAATALESISPPGEKSDYNKAAALAWLW